MLPDKHLNVIHNKKIQLYINHQQVEFVGEEGADTGGLSREFFTIVEKDIIRKYMHEDAGTFKHNSVALQVT